MEGGGAGSQPSDTRWQRPPSNPTHNIRCSIQPPQMVAGGMESIPATLSHGGRFIQYNIFEVTAKYKPPIVPIGKGGYGIVWRR